jgi:hypothetical protein
VSPASTGPDDGAVFVVFGLALPAAWLGEPERRARLGSVAPR